MLSVGDMVLRPKGRPYVQKDISGGIEKIPIPLVNEVDDTILPLEFGVCRRVFASSHLPCCRWLACVTHAHGRLCSVYAIPLVLDHVCRGTRCGGSLQRGEGLSV